MHDNVPFSVFLCAVGFCLLFLSAWLYLLAIYLIPLVVVLCAVNNMMARLVKRPPPSATSQPEPESASKPKFIAKPRSPPLGFLSLPPELRNVIYDYVLTSPSGQLHYRPLQLNVKPEGGSEYYLTSSANDSGSRSNFQFFLRGIFITPVMEEFNQLQHVSKQVRAETAGLSLDPRNNTIHFDYCPDTTHSANAHVRTACKKFMYDKH